MRFKLKTIFFVTFVAAVMCMVLFTLPDWLSVIILAAVATVTPGAIVAGIIYGRKAKRAFAIGCLASGGWALWLMPLIVYAELAGASFSDDPLFVKLVFAGYYLILSLGGLACVGVRRLCYQGRNGIRPPRDCC